jgi:hypothetical protein
MCIREPARHADRQRATDIEHPDQFGDRHVVPRYVFQHLGRDHAVERLVGIGQIQRVTEDRRRRRRRGRLTFLGHRLQDGLHGPQFGRIAVEGDDVGTAPVRLEGMPAGPTAHVDHLDGRPHPEPVEIDCQHWPSPGVARRAIARS